MINNETTLPQNANEVDASNYKELCELQKKTHTEYPVSDQV